MGLEVLGQLDEVLQRAAEAVELGDHELVAFAGDEKGFVEFEAASKLAGHLVCEDLLAASRAECVLLGFGVPSRYARERHVVLTNDRYPALG
ncbi:hypothetical protein OG572_01160 [Streptomyces virginiae]|uniref:Uncharacterized protein n=1 Tax=Streptomyces virginiae TaxID=1961 RepID=A0ABZ1TQR8_STRVG|nr:hypothetical protein [Streptomyces virginiae]